MRRSHGIDYRRSSPAPCDLIGEPLRDTDFSNNTLAKITELWPRTGALSTYGSNRDADIDHRMRATTAAGMSRRRCSW